MRGDLRTNVKWFGSRRPGGGPQSTTCARPSSLGACPRTPQPRPSDRASSSSARPAPASPRRPITEIFFDEGEPHFRELEREAVTTALATHAGILALGGGAVLDPLTQSALASYVKAGGNVVFLDVSLSAAAPRVGFNRSRPLLLGNPRAQWQKMMAARRPVYESVATMSINTDSISPKDVAAKIADALTSSPENRS